MPYRDYTEKELILAIKNNNSIAGVLRSIGLKAAGGNYQTIKLFVQHNNIDVSHWTGKLWSKGKRLKEINNYSRPHKIKQVLSEKRGWSCEKCGRGRWMGKPIPLECHHIDHDRTNNSEKNLMLLCRNCHFVLHGKK